MLPRPNLLTKCSIRLRGICDQWSSDLWNVTCTLDLAHPYPKRFPLTTLTAAMGCMPGDINFLHLHTLPYFKKRESVFALISTRDKNKNHVLCN